MSVETCKYVTIQNTHVQYMFKAILSWQMQWIHSWFVSFKGNFKAIWEIPEDRRFPKGESEKLMEREYCIDLI